MKLNPELISIKTVDGAKVDGLMFSKIKKRKVVVLIHGACMNFLEGASSFIPELTSSYENYDFFAVNMRAHDLGYIVDHYEKKEGWAWQTIEKNRLDIDAICSFLHNKDYSEIILCGHSWGGLICCDYINHIQKAKCGRLILLSPTVSFKLLIEVNYLYAKEQLVEQAKSMISSGMGNSIICTSTRSPIPFMSAKTVLEFVSSDFELYNFLKATNYCVDIVVGGLEHKKLQEFSVAASRENDTVYSHIIKKSNHFYTGYEIELVRMIDSILGM